MVRLVTIQRPVAQGLRILGVLAVLEGLYLLAGMLRVAFHLPPEGIAAALPAAAILLTAVAGVGRILWVRAQEITALGDSPLPLIPMVSILLRTGGETYAMLGISAGFGGGLFAWLARRDPLGLLGGFGRFVRMPSVEAGFGGGVSFFLSLSVASFYTLMLFYFVAESTVAIADGVGRIWVAAPSAAISKPTFPVSRDRAVP